MKIILSTGMREIRDEWEEGDLGISGDQLEANVVNICAIALVCKICITFSSTKTRILMLDHLYKQMKQMILDPECVDIKE